MNMLKFGYGIVLDGLPDIPEFHFFLGSGHPQTRFSLNVVVIFSEKFFFFLLPPLCHYYVCSNPIMIIFSMDGHHLAFFIGHNIIIVSFAIRSKAALKTLMQIYLATYMRYIFFPRSLRSLGI